LIVDRTKALFFEPKIGAEAVVSLVNWQGMELVCKTRMPKSYRNAKLDQLLRTRRTRQEVQILHESKLARVKCPTVFFADPKKAMILMERIYGVLLKDAEQEASAARSSEYGHAPLTDAYNDLGRFASRLHSAGIIHGDLTTKNVVISQSGGAYILDFGLSFFSQRIEDQAEDLHLLKQALTSTLDSDTAKSRFSDVIQAYTKELRKVPKKNARKILNQIEEIEKRGRYARVD
jgi:TP53 regulating kinase-like protein